MLDSRNPTPTKSSMTPDVTNPRHAVQQLIPRFAACSNPNFQFILEICCALLGLFLLRVYFMGWEGIISDPGKSPLVCLLLVYFRGWEGIIPKYPLPTISFLPNTKTLVHASVF